MQGGAAAKAHRQKMEAHASELATLALDRVRTKLLNNTTVEYTVNELIRTATDPVNLATIYHGKLGRILTMPVADLVISRMATMDVDRHLKHGGIDDRASRKTHAA